VAILTETVVRRRLRRRKDFQLSEAEQARVKLAMHALRILLGGWQAVASASGYTYKAVTCASVKRSSVTGTMALRIALAAGMPLDDLLRGACPMCRGTGQRR
jgi:hypothetical protein